MHEVLSKKMLPRAWEEKNREENNKDDVSKVMSRRDMVGLDARLGITELHGVFFALLWRDHPMGHQTIRCGGTWTWAMGKLDGQPPTFIPAGGQHTQPVAPIRTPFDR